MANSVTALASNREPDPKTPGGHEVDPCFVCGGKVDGLGFTKECRMSAKLPRHDGVKSHKVPAFYLRQWQDGKCQLRVRDKLNGREYRAAPEKLVLEQGFYSKKHEKFFSILEGWFAQDWLLSWQSFSDPNVRRGLAYFLAMQERRSQKMVNLLSHALDRAKSGEVDSRLARRFRKMNLRTLFDEQILGFRSDVNAYLSLKWTLIDLQAFAQLETCDCPVVSFQENSRTRLFYFPIAPGWAMMITDAPGFKDGWVLSMPAPPFVNAYNLAIRDSAIRHVVLPP